MRGANRRTKRTVSNVVHVDVKLVEVAVKTVWVLNGLKTVKSTLVTVAVEVAVAAGAVVLMVLVPRNDAHSVLTSLISLAICQGSPSVKPKSSRAPKIALKANETLRC